MQQLGLLFNQRNLKSIRSIICFLLIVSFYSCVDKQVRVIDKYGESLSEIRLVDYGIDMEEVGRLSLNIDTKNYSLSNNAEVVSIGKINKEDLHKLKLIIGEIKVNQLDHIYNSNSADASLFQLKFWGINADYAHIIEVYGMHDLPIEIKSAFEHLRKLNKTLGRNK